jgi:hypothetical protein
LEDLVLLNKVNKEKAMHPFDAEARIPHLKKKEVHITTSFKLGREWLQ